MTMYALVKWLRILSAATLLGTGAVIALYGLMIVKPALTAPLGS